MIKIYITLIYCVLYMKCGIVWRCWWATQSVTALRRYSVTVAVRHSLYTEIIINPNRSLGNRKLLRFNCRIVQCTGITLTPYLVLPTRPCAMERQRFPLATERGRSILHRNSIVIASLLDMITENKPRSRQYRAEIERPKWAMRAVR